MLVGLRAISSKTGKNVGFDPSRFCPLDQFRLKFPKGISSIQNDVRVASEGMIKRTKQARPSAIPEIDGVQESRSLVTQSIEVLEELFLKNYEVDEEETWLDTGFVPDQSAPHVRMELMELLQSPQLYASMNQSWTFWQMLSRRSARIIFFSRQRSPVANIVYLMCKGGSRFTAHYLNGMLCESDFHVLIHSAGMLSGSPIRFCDARDPDVFLKVLFDAHPHFDCAFCDWPLAGAELVAAYKMTSDGRISFLCPQSCSA
ncbi:MAG: hypothetical protein WCS42_14890 [Verrucomicrobiota bacterium]